MAHAKNCGIRRRTFICGAALIGAASWLAAMELDAVQVATAADPSVAKPHGEAIGSGSADAPTPSVRPAQPALTETRPIGNPLWAIPLDTLPATRERPLFSPSRRPPPPKFTALDVGDNSPPPRPTGPSGPSVTLLGTAVYGSAGIGVFIDETTHSVVRLKRGEAHSGWILHWVGRREVQFTKDGTWATLAIRPVHDEPSAHSGDPAAPAADAETGARRALAPPTKPASREHSTLPTSAAEAIAERNRIRRER
jgi:general secretion pathway protein N